MAKQSPQMGFTSLAYLMDIDWLKEAYQAHRKDGAVGVDGVTADEYEQELEGNSVLPARLREVRHVPARARAAGAHPERRPGHRDPSYQDFTLEDKVLQRAVVMLLEPIYEQDFHDCSYGFRRGRLGDRAAGLLPEPFRWVVGGGWVLEVDIRKFFDTLDHGH